MIDKLLRWTPPFKGKQRLARFILRSTIREERAITVTGKFGCTYKVPNIKENVGFEILINGIFEADTIHFICSHLQSGTVLLDIGANIGAITIPVGTLRNDCMIVGLEASPGIFEYLNHNATINGLRNIKLINKAISDKGGQQVDFFSPADKFGKGSMAPVFTNAAEKVETITLDELAATTPGTVGMIKADVEGFEAFAFRGGKQLLSATNAPDILFEFEDWAEQAAGETPGAAQAILLQYDYQLFQFSDGKIGDQIQTPLTRGSAMIYGRKGKYS